MLLPLLLAQAALRDLTPAGAQARGYLLSVARLAGLGGYGSLGKHRLPPGDVEVRFWGGFALWGTRGLVLRKRAGRWTAVRIGGLHPERRKALPAPRSGWPAFWGEAERRGIFTLPDQNQIKDKKGLAGIDDGYSNLVEFQRDGVYRAYAYDNPANQSTWPPARPMAALDRLVGREFPLFLGPE